MQTQMHTQTMLQTQPQTQTQTQTQVGSNFDPVTAAENDHENGGDDAIDLDIDTET
jgi:hypothetical protein